jgi:hypothetical protein
MVQKCFLSFKNQTTATTSNKTSTTSNKTPTTSYKTPTTANQTPTTATTIFFLILVSFILLFKLKIFNIQKNFK